MEQYGTLTFLILLIGIIFPLVMPLKDLKQWNSLTKDLAS